LGETEFDRGRPGTRRMKDYRLVDWATQGYLAVVALLTLFFHNETVSHWAAMVILHLTAIVGIHLLIRAHAARPGGKVRGFFRAFYPMLLYTAFYRETEYLNRMFADGYLDLWFLRLEEQLFGGQPSVHFMEWLPARWFAELMYAAYFSYYLMIIGVGIALYLRDRRQFAHYLTVVSLLFYACYLTYVFLPVCGPRLFFEDFDGIAISAEMRQVGLNHPMPASVAGGLFPSVILLIYRHLEAAGAAFPSSHVAVAICTAWFSFLYLRRIRYWHALTTALLCVSTVYCRYHYVVDVLAGILTAFLIVPIANWLYRRTDPADSPIPTTAPVPAHESLPPR
jgi:membrane-associated phospholipid phosphatase